MDAPLTAVIRGLDPLLRDHVSDLGIRFLGDFAEVSVRFALYIEGAVVDDESPWVIKPQMGMDGAEPQRWPTIVRRIPTKPSLRRQVDDLEASWLLGCLRNDRNRSGHDYEDGLPHRSWGPPGQSWRILTHAGDVKERWRWLGSLRRASVAG